MTAPRIDERTRLTIALALTAGSDDAGLRDRQDAQARRLGMTGAEIDAARDGRSFDLRCSAAIAVALAAGGDGDICRHVRDRALRAGISDALCSEIEAFAVESTRNPHHV